jgi:hypothetical protein
MKFYNRRQQATPSPDAARTPDAVAGWISWGVSALIGLLIVTFCFVTYPSDAGDRLFLCMRIFPCLVPVFLPGILCYLIFGCLALCLDCLYTCCNRRKLPPFEGEPVVVVVPPSDLGVVPEVSNSLTQKWGTVGPRQ